MQLSVTRPGVTSPVRIDPTGTSGPTPGQARGPRWRTTSAGLVVPATVDGSASYQRIVEAVAGLPDGSAATGWAALHWQRARWFEGRTADGRPLPVPVAVGERVGLRRRQGIGLCYGWLFADDVIEVDGLPLTRPERSVFMAVRAARSLEAAVQVVAMACAADLVSLDELRSYSVRLRGRQHTRRLADAIALADENLWSPMEATLLLRWLAAGRCRPLCNRPIFDRSGRHLLTPDLLDPVAGVLGEYDGLVHDTRTVRRRDLGREELARELGLEVVTMISTDLRDLAAFEQRLAAAYRRAARRTPSDAWTLEPPPGWVDTTTVAARRALDARTRARLLGRRAA